MKYTRAIALLGVLLGACTEPTVKMGKIHAPKKNRVQEESFHHRLMWPQGESQPSPEASLMLGQFVRMHQGSGMHMEIEGSAADGLFMKKGKRISDYLVRLGVPRHRITLRATAPDQALDHLTVTARVFEVVPPACPDWSYGLGDGIMNIPYSNFGCANEMALGQMVVDPRDLKDGSTAVGQHGSATAQSMQRYRDGKLRQLDTTSSTSISSGSGGSSTSSSSTTNNNASSSSSSGSYA